MPSTTSLCIPSSIKFAQVIELNNADITLGSVVQILYARSSVFCVEHPETKKLCFIRRSEVRSLETA